MKLTLSANKVAEQRTAINVIRDAKEVAPVEVTIPLGTFTLDCDEKAESRMSNALLLWDSLNITTLDWTLSDNSVVTLTKTQLQETYDATLVARGSRSLNLHAYAASLKASLPVEDFAYMFDAELWDI